MLNNDIDNKNDLFWIILYPNMRRPDPKLWIDHQSITIRPQIPGFPYPIVKKLIDNVSIVLDTTDSINIDSNFSSTLVNDACPNAQFQSSIDDTPQAPVASTIDPKDTIAEQTSSSMDCDKIESGLISIESMADEKESNTSIFVDTTLVESNNRVVMDNMSFIVFPPQQPQSIIDESKNNNGFILSPPSSPSIAVNQTLLIDESNEADLTKQTVVTLRNMCKTKGLSTKGNKSDLIQRLLHQPS